MKKIIFIAFAVTIVFQSIGQQADSIPMLSKSDYLLKSKRQKKTGLVLLGVGGLMTGTGLIISLGEGLSNILVAEAERSNSGAVLTIAGVIIMGSSIPFFTGSSSSRKKALSLSLKTEKALYVSGYELSYTSIPSLNLKIRL